MSWLRIVDKIGYFLNTLIDLATRPVSALQPIGSKESEKLNSKSVVSVVFVVENYQDVAGC